MIKVHIKNFQSLEDVEFDIDGFTTITGESDLGKSAVIRAIDFALSNERATDFVRHGKKKCEVSLDFGDIKIEWEKGKSTSYKINDKEFNKMGNNPPPDEIIKYGIRDIVFDKRKLMPQIQNQHGYMFLINETDSVKAGFVGSLSTAFDLAKASRECNAYIKNLNSQLKVNSESLNKYKAQSENVEIGYESIKKDYISLTQLDASIESSKKIISNIEAVVSFDKVNKYKIDLDFYNGLIKQNKCDQLLSLIASIDYYIKYTMLNTIVSDINVVKELLNFDKLTNMKVYLDTLNYAYGFYVKFNYLSECISINNNVVELEKNILTLVNLYSSLINAMSVINEYNVKGLSLKGLIESRDQLGLQIVEVEKQFNICPTCGRPNICKSCGNTI